MKLLVAVGVALAITVPLQAKAAIALSDTNETSFDIGGTIEPECRAATNASENASSLNLASSSPQTAGSVAIWCNTGQEIANATYESANSGFLVNESGDSIAYTLSVSGSDGEISLSNPQTISQLTGTGTDGEDVASNVSVTPQLNGFEAAGSYQDTIQVTVTVN